MVAEGRLLRAEAMRKAKGQLTAVFERVRHEILNHPTVATSIRHLCAPNSWQPAGG
jgi:hypothetical protein